MSQPTGSTQIPVPKEQAAEAQEDAAEQAEMSIIDQILSYKPTPAGNTLANIEKFYITEWQYLYSYLFLKAR